MDLSVNISRVFDVLDDSPMSPSRYDVSKTLLAAGAKGTFFFSEYYPMFLFASCSLTW